MSYTLDRIIVRSSQDGSWELNEIYDGAMTLDHLYNNYTGVVLALTSSIAVGTYYFDLYNEIPTISDTDITVSDWLLATDYKNIKVESTPPNVTLRHVMYMDATRANYNFEKVAIGRHSDSTLNESEKIDLKLTRPDTDYDRMNEFCLVSINGIFHYSEPLNDGLVVHEGVRGFEVGRTFNVGIHSFTGLGKITKIPLTLENTGRVSFDTPLSAKIKITPEIDLTNKTVLLCLGGYLHHFDEVYSVVDNTVEIDMQRFLLPDRLFDALRRTDLKNVYNLMDNRKFRSVRKDVMLSDEFIAKYATTSQSFLVVIDTPVVHKKWEQLKNDKVPGIYTTKQRPTKPLITGMGRVCEYYPEPEYSPGIGQYIWVLNCTEPYKNGFGFNTLYSEDIESYSSDLEPSYETEETDGYFLNLYVESLTVPGNGDN